MPGLPRGVVFATTATGRRYFVNHITKQTTWDAPEGYTPAAKQAEQEQHDGGAAAPSTAKAGEAVADSNSTKPAAVSEPLATPAVPLPRGWTTSKTAAGRTFYIDHNTKQTHWKLPEDAATAAAAEGEAEAAVPAAQEPLTSPGGPLAASTATGQLRQAAKQGDVAGVTRLLAAAAGGGGNASGPGVAEPDAQDGEGRTALMWAADHGHVACVAALLHAGAAVGVTDRGGATALAMAARSGRAGCVQELLRAGAPAASIAVELQSKPWLCPQAAAAAAAATTTRARGTWAITHGPAAPAPSLHPGPLGGGLEMMQHRQQQHPAEWWRLPAQAPAGAAAAAGSSHHSNAAVLPPERRPPAPTPAMMTATTSSNNPAAAAAAATHASPTKTNRAPPLMETTMDQPMLVPPQSQEQLLAQKKRQYEASAGTASSSSSSSSSSPSSELSASASSAATMAGAVASKKRRRGEAKEDSGGGGGGGSSYLAQLRKEATHAAACAASSSSEDAVAQMRAYEQRLRGGSRGSAPAGGSSAGQSSTSSQPPTAPSSVQLGQDKASAQSSNTSEPDAPKIKMDLGALEKAKAVAAAAAERLAVKKRLEGAVHMMA
jgi:hypothetical protein